MRTFFFENPLHHRGVYGVPHDGGLTFLALGYTLKEKGHIRMTFLHTVLRGKKRLLLEALCLLTGLVFTLLMTWTTSLFFWDSVVFGSRSMQISETYLAIPQFFLPLGSGIFCPSVLCGAASDSGGAFRRFRRGSSRGGGYPWR